MLDPIRPSPTHPAVAIENTTGTSQRESKTLVHRHQPRAGGPVRKQAGAAAKAQHKSDHRHAATRRRRESSAGGDTVPSWLRERSRALNEGCPTSSTDAWSTTWPSTGDGPGRAI